MIHTADHDYQLKYTYNAFCAYEERYGRSIIADMQNSGFSVLRGLIWAGLIHLNPRMPFSELEVGNIIEEAINNGMDAIALKEEVDKAVQDANFMRRLSEMTEKRLSEQAKKAGKEPTENEPMK